MRFPFYIARRYLISKKKHNAINLISAISAFGVMGGSLAFILVLSVFNGFEGVVLSLFNAFHAEVRITPAEGKTFTLSAMQQEQIRKIPGVVHYHEVIEEIALLRYRGKQHIASLKGVEEQYGRAAGLDTLMYAGDFEVGTGEMPRGVMGAGVAFKLGIILNDIQNPVSVYMANRHAAPGDMTGAFSVQEIFPAGVFTIQQDIDNRYVMVPLKLMRELLEYDNEVTSVELVLAPGASVRKVKDQLSRQLGDGLVIQDKFEQQALLYRIIRSEKWAIVAILSFILLLAIFNVIGSLTMLILEKKKDIAVLQTLGADNKLIRRIFLLEGVLISFFGVVAGLLIGGLLAWLQQTFGIITIGASETLVIDAYPVKIQWSDFLLIFVVVMGIGLLAAWLPVRRLSAKAVEYKL